MSLLVSLYIFVNLMFHFLYFSFGFSFKNNEWVNTNAIHTWIDPSHEKTTLRQTQVIIVPFCDYFDTFQAYEGVIQAINLARKNARDLVTDASIEKMELMEMEWKYVFMNNRRMHVHHVLCCLVFDCTAYDCVLYSFLTNDFFLYHNAIYKIYNTCKQNSVSINGASLHPLYGEKSHKELIEELEKMEKDRRN